MNLRAVLSAAVLAIGIGGGLAMADVTGTVKFEGKAPARRPINMGGIPQCAQQHKTPVFEETLVVGKGGELANVVVSLKNPPAGGQVPSEPVVLDQKGCQYSPHVLPMMVGQKVLVRNSDPFLHNVHGLPEENPGFNFAQNNVDPGKAVGPMKTAEYFRVKCDVHPWMSAWFAVFSHPYFGVTDQSGKFTITGVPDGEHEVVLWHERLGESEATVTVKGGKGELNTTMAPEEEASATPPSIQEIVETKTVLLSAASSAKSECGACCEASKKAAAVAETK
jgi:plastocyanin